jgi:hypothetical protein
LSRIIWINFVHVVDRTIPIVLAGLAKRPQRARTLGSRDRSESSSISFWLPNRIIRGNPLDVREDNMRVIGTRELVHTDGRRTYLEPTLMAFREGREYCNAA